MSVSTLKPSGPPIPLAPTAFLRWGITIMAASAALALSSLPLGAHPGSVPAPLVLVIAWLTFLIATGRWRREVQPSVAGDAIALFWIKAFLATALFALWYALIQQEVQVGNVLPLGSDVFRLEEISSQIVETGALGYPLDHPPLEQLGFSYLTAAIYWIFGRSLFLITALNIVVGTLLAVETFRIGRLMLPLSESRIAFWLAALMPDFIIYSFLGYKDMLVVYLLFFSFRLMLTTDTWNGWLRRVPLIAGVTYAIVELRSAALPILVIFALVASGMRQKIGGQDRAALRWAVVVGMVVMVSAAALVARSSGVENVLAQLPTSGTFQVVAGQSSGLEFTDSAQSSLALRTFWNYQPALAFLIPLRAALIPLVPSPILFGNLVLTLQSIAVWVMAGAIPLVVWASRDMWRRRAGDRRPLIAIVIPLLVLLLALATVEPVLESRHRLVVMPLVALLSAHGLANWQRSKIAFLYAAPLGVAAVGAYGAFKIVSG